jgi:hypothetical protein
MSAEVRIMADNLPELTLPEKLQRYRIHRREMLFLYLGWPFAAVFSAISFKRLFDREPAFWAGYILLVLWALVIAMKWHRLIRLPCPICERTILKHPLRACKQTNTNA